MHLLIAREAVDPHLQVAGDILEAETPLQDKARAPSRPAAFYAKWLPKLVVGEGHQPEGYDEFGELATYLRYAERSSRRLARSTFYAMGRWQAKLEQRQSFLGRIVDIGAELFAISAAVVYADTIARETPERADAARELAALFCAQAKRRSDELFTRCGPTTTTRATRPRSSSSTAATSGSKRASWTPAIRPSGLDRRAAGATTPAAHASLID